MLLMICLWHLNDFVSHFFFGIYIKQLRTQHLFWLSDVGSFSLILDIISSRQHKMLKVRQLLMMTMNDSGIIELRLKILFKSNAPACERKLATTTEKKWNSYRAREWVRMNVRISSFLSPNILHAYQSRLENFCDHKHTHIVYHNVIKRQKFDIDDFCCQLFASGEKFHGEPKKNISTQTEHNNIDSKFSNVNGALK